MAVTVREKPKGSGNWWIFINHRGKRKSKKIGKDKKIALKVAEKIKAKLVLNELSIEKINSKCPNFKEYAEMWLSLPHERKESIQQNYRRYLKDYIYPHIGNVRVDQIGRKDFKLLFDKIAIKGTKLSSCRTIMAPINGVLDHAVDSELIEVNHLKNIKCGKSKLKYKVTPLTEKETVSLLNEMLNFRDGFFTLPYSVY